MEHPGRIKLKAWRESFTPTLSQLKVAERVGASQPLIAEWENAGSNRRPGIETAVLMETATGGAVCVEDWGYERRLVTSMASLVDRRREDGDSLTPAAPEVAA